MRGKIFALFVVFVLFLEVFAFAGALSSEQESSDSRSSSSYSESSTTDYSSPSSYSSSSSSSSSYSESSTTDYSSYSSYSSSDSGSESSTPSTSASLPSYDFYGSPLDSINGEDCLVEGCLNGRECNYETGVCGEVESNSDNLVSDKEKKDLKASDASLAKKALDFATKPLIGGDFSKAAKNTAEAGKQKVYDEIDTIEEKLKDPSLSFLDRFGLQNRLNALREEAGNLDAAPKAIDMVLPTKLDLAALGVGGLLAKGAGLFGKLVDGLKGLLGGSKVVDTGVKAVESGAEVVAKTVDAGAKSTDVGVKTAEMSAEEAVNVARKQIQNDLDAAKQMVAEAKTQAEKEYANQELKSLEDALKSFEKNPSSSSAKIVPSSTTKWNPDRTYARIVSDAEYAQIMKTGRLEPRAAGELIPVLDVNSKKSLSELNSMSRSNLGNLHKRIGGSGANKRIIFFKSKTPPTADNIRLKGARSSMREAKFAGGQIEIIN